MAKKLIYAVAYGVDPDTSQPVEGIKLYSWAECDRYIRGVKNARYKGFMTEEEADEWIASVLAVKRANTTPQTVTVSQKKLDNVLKSMDSLHEAMDELTYDELTALYATACHSRGVNPTKILQMVTVMLYNDDSYYKKQGDVENDTSVPWE